jgi:hypothetical protein
MATLVLESFPESLHARLKHAAESHHWSVTQETVHLLEAALGQSEAPSPVRPSYWADRPLLPGYSAAIQAGAFSGGIDSTRMVSEERDAR